MKPISQPCLRNQDPIYQQLKNIFINDGKVLELGCGTGQHGVYMASHLPHLFWQSSDLLPAIEGANLWIKEADLENLPLAIGLNIANENWPKNIAKVDYIYSANLVHFVGMEKVQNMFKGIEKVLKAGGLLALYGPYNDQGYTSEGNARLDVWLKQDVDKTAGIKELADISTLAKEHGLELKQNILMPANNHLLIFEKVK